MARQDVMGLGVREPGGKHQACQDTGQEGSLQQCLVIAKHQRPRKCPSAGGGYRVRPAHSMEYCVAGKMNEIELYVPTWVILQSHLRAKAILP